MVADVQSDNRITALVITTTMTSQQGKPTERFSDRLLCSVCQQSSACLLIPFLFSRKVSEERCFHSGPLWLWMFSCRFIC